MIRRTRDRERRQVEKRRGEDISDKTYNKKNQEERLCDYVMEYTLVWVYTQFQVTIPGP